MKKIILSVLFFISFDIAAIEVSISSERQFDEKWTVKLNDTQFIFERGYKNAEGNYTAASIEKYDIQWERIHTISYIIFHYTGKFLGDAVSNGQKRYLILYNANCLMLYDKTTLFFRISNIWHYPFTTGARASSELSESGTLYRVNNLLDITRLRPWAEGARDEGRGETIKLEIREYLLGEFRILLFSNGFVDFSRPYLYEQNNRIKKIRIYNGAKTHYKDIMLEDTPQFQTILLDNNFNANSKKLEIEILEVYYGTKYNDTCINTILAATDYRFQE
jgi:hypothetical protein